MTWPDWFTYLFMFAVIDWVIVENVVLVWALRELIRIRKLLEGKKERRGSYTVKFNP